MRKKIRAYNKLIKTGIIVGNLVTVIAGFCLATQDHFDVLLLIICAVGICCVIASATVLNNIIDRDIDLKMQRTQSRPLVNGDISLKQATIISIVLGIFGFGVLYFYVNTLTAILALIGYIDYIVFYTLIFKRTSVLSTVVGSISGAIPSAVGYSAVKGSLDFNVGLLFLIFASWQIAHTYAIVLYRANDYKSANIPLLPLQIPLRQTQYKMIMHIVILLVSIMLLIMNNGFSWYVSFILILALLLWLFSVIKPITIDAHKWGKKEFIHSLYVVLSISIALILTRL